MCLFIVPQEVRFSIAKTGLKLDIEKQLEYDK